MTSLLLTLDLTGERHFDIERLRRCLEQMPGVRNLGTQRGLFCCFDYAADTTDISLVDSQCIAIHDNAPVSLKAALEIYSLYGEDLHAFDDDCTFHVVLSTVSSLADFKDKIERGLGHEDLQRK
jgi:hypothetical protein